MFDHEIEMKVRPPNSVIFISGRRNHSPLPDLESEIVLASKDCIMIGCTYEGDSDTQVILSSLPPKTSSYVAEYSFMLETPDKVATLDDLDDKVYASVPVPNKLTNVRIFVDSLREPSKIHIKFD